VHISGLEADHHPNGLSRLRHLWIFALVMGVVPVLAGTFMSFSRYLLMCYPLFWGLELIYKNKPVSRPIILGWIASAFMLQSLFIARAANSYWMS